MITAEQLLPASPSDADLVRSSLNGTSAAFAEIVARYQALISSLTYSATGSLARSEDLAQEVFVAAWKELGQLREPEKLRPWLCGIARRLAASARRHEGREPACAARELEDDLHSAAAGPAEQAISREEESILWRSLEQIPETYREPLILFYREEQSVDRVAAALDLSADTAKQRLSRGRKMLKEQVALFVEGALRQSTPGRAFTTGVITSLPLMTASASGATIGAAAVKSGSAATGLGSAAAGVLLGPLIGCLGAWIGVKASLASAESERERELIRAQTRRLIALVLGFTVLIVLAITFQQRLWANATTAAIVLCALLPITYAVVLTALILRFRRAHARVIAEETPKRTPQTAASQAQGNTPFEYRSKATLLGLPLIHVRVGVRRGEKMRPALGWVAVGDISVGVLISFGGIAVGGISVGGLSLGLFAIGGVASGGLAMGGVALGYAAAGGLAIGYLAYGGCAVAWHAAKGGMAAALEVAVGGAAHAPHANDAVAYGVIESVKFFGSAEWILRHPLWMNLAWAPLLLVVWQSVRRQRALKTKPAGT